MTTLTPIQRALVFFDNSPTKMATALSSAAVAVSRQNVEHWVRSGKVPERHVRPIHDLGAGLCWEFCPEDWWRIWPDLIDVKGAPAVPREPEVAAQGAN